MRWVILGLISLIFATSVAAINVDFTLHAASSLWDVACAQHDECPSSVFLKDRSGDSKNVRALCGAGCFMTAKEYAFDLKPYDRVIFRGAESISGLPPKGEFAIYNASRTRFTPDDFVVSFNADEITSPSEKMFELEMTSEGTLQIPDNVMFRRHALLEVVRDFIHTGEFSLEWSQTKSLGRASSLLPSSDFGNASLSWDTPMVRMWFGTDMTKTSTTDLEETIYACQDSDSNGLCDGEQGVFCAGDYYAGACCDQTAGCSSVGNAICAGTPNGWRWITKPGEVVDVNCPIPKWTGTWVGGGYKCERGDFLKLNASAPYVRFLDQMEGTDDETAVSPLQCGADEVQAGYILDDVPGYWFGKHHKKWFHAYETWRLDGVAQELRSVQLCLKGVDDAKWEWGSDYTTTPSDAPGCGDFFDAGQVTDRWWQGGATYSDVRTPNNFRNYRLCLKGVAHAFWVKGEPTVSPSAEAPICPSPFVSAGEFKEMSRVTYGVGAKAGSSWGWSSIFTLPVNVYDEISGQLSGDSPSQVYEYVPYRLCTLPLQTGVPDLDSVGPQALISDRNETHEFLCLDDDSVAECTDGGSAWSGSGFNTGDDVSTGTSTFYCSSDNFWRNDLDLGPGDIVGKETCNAAGLHWTGSMCCAEADDRPEYYEDTVSTDPAVGGGCWDSNYISFGETVEDGRVINYNGEFYGCEPPGTATIPSPLDLKIVVGTCGSSYLEDATRVAEEHAVCGPAGYWNIFSGRLISTVEKRVFWWGDVQTGRERGCCPPDQCWDGIRCYGMGSTKKVGRQGYRCVPQ